MQTVDARGLACPQPVILARRAMQAAEPLTVIVDNEIAVANVTRMARAAGWATTVETRPDGTFIALTPPAGATPQPAPAAGAAMPAAGATVVLLAADTIGSGDDTLGAILMRAFLHTLAEGDAKPDAIICVNGGVRLPVSDSPVLEDMQTLAACGTDILICGTCLDFYHLKDSVAVGTISNMYTIAEILLAAGRVVRM
ncbi:MAG: sulfurtransferase-like selenium metabolism protein YedF [Anaerolineae bacterium]